MNPNHQVSLSGLMLLMTGIAVAIGLGRAVLLAPAGNSIAGHLVAPILGAWCGAVYGAIRGDPAKWGGIGFVAGMGYLLFAPLPFEH